MSVGELMRFVATWALTFVAAGQLASDFWARRVWLVALFFGVSLLLLGLLAPREGRMTTFAAVAVLAGVLGIGRVAATAASGGLAASSADLVVQLLCYGG